MSVSEERIYVGVGGCALAVNPQNGEEIWRTVLCMGVPVVSVIFSNGRLFASGGGDLWRLDPDTGTVLWKNKLKGLGVGFVSIAAPSPEEEREEQVARLALISGAAFTSAGRRSGSD